MRQKLDEGSDAITLVDVDILVSNGKVGNIEAIIVDRQKIPERCFYATVDSHLQTFGRALMEPRRGRTLLKSLADYDSGDFMLISKFHVDDEYKGNSDVAAIALRQFLRHPFISGQTGNGCWRVSSVAYGLDSLEYMPESDREAWKQHIDKCREMSDDEPSAEEKVAMEEEARQWKAQLVTWARQDANPFLRNGFFQDEAIAKMGAPKNRILVASYGHFCAPLKTHEEALAVQFYTPPPPETNPVGKNGELFEYMKSACGDYGVEITTIRTEIETFLRSGATVADSNILHVACVENKPDIVELILQLDPTVIDRVEHGHTALMLAAVKASGSRARPGHEDTRVLDLLLANGANKALQNRSGMTAYGLFDSGRKKFDIMIQAMMGQPVVPKAPDRSQQFIMARLMPPGGPSPNDLTGGRHAGIIDYSAEEKLPVFDASDDYAEIW